MPADAKDIIEACDELASRRATFDNLYEDCARFCLPREQDLVNPESTPEGGEKPSPVNAIGIRCTSQLASGLYSNTVSLGKKWFGLRPGRKEGDETDDVKEWLIRATEKAIELIQESNFALQYHEMLQPFCCMGIGVMYEELTGEGKLRCRAHGLDGLYVAEDADGIVDTVYRKFQYTAKQAVQKFGDDNLHEEIRKKAANPKDQHQKVSFIHAVYPRIGRDKQRNDSQNMPWASVYVDVERKSIVRESGYMTFPFQVPRFFKNDNESYGRSVAMNALPDLRMINRAEADYMNAVEMAIVPPIFLPAGTESEDVSLTPGYVNHYNPETGGEPHEYATSSRIDLGKDYLLRKEEQIREAFFVDLFLALENQQNMTATEVAERINEKIQAITPVVSRLQSEFFEPFIERVVMLMHDADMLPPMPAGLMDDEGQFAEYGVEYTTRLNAKLQQVEIDALVRSIQQAASIAEAMLVADELRATFDLMKIGRAIARANNLDEDMIRSEDDAQEMLQQMVEAKQQQMAAEQAAQAIKPVDMQKRSDPGSPATMLETEASGPMMQ